MILVGPLQLEVLCDSGGCAVAVRCWEGMLGIVNGTCSIIGYAVFRKKIETLMVYDFTSLCF